MAQRATGKGKGGATIKGGGKAVLSCRRDGNPVTAIVMRAWLAVTGVPPAVYCRNTGLSNIALCGNGRQAGLKAGETGKAENSRKRRGTLAVSCIRWHFRLYDNGKIKTDNSGFDRPAQVYKKRCPR